MPALRATIHNHQYRTPTFRDPAYRLTLRWFLLVWIVFCGMGCGTDSGDSNDARDSSDKTAESNAEDADSNQQVANKKPSTAKANGKSFRPITLPGFGSGDGTSGSSSQRSGGDSTQSVLDELKPLQVLLGAWRGTTRKEYENFKAVDQHGWVFDLQTDQDQPALVMTSDKSPYVETARVTYLPETDKFRMTLVDREGHQRELMGEFTEPVQDKAEDGRTLQRSYKLQFTQEERGDAPNRWQIVLNQQENNRYLMVISRAMGQQQSFRLYDTVSIQREGTSFALSDSDYGEKTCIISQGLGTTAVSFEGKTYWVCCSGCKAAFEEDPEKWIAKAAAREMAESE